LAVNRIWLIQQNIRTYDKNQLANKHTESYLSQKILYNDQPTDSQWLYNSFVLWYG